MEFLNEYHLAGLFIGICTFLIIGLFHPVVVKAEYYWGTKCWWIFLVLGIAGVIASLSIDNVILSSLLGVFAFSSFWTIKEVFEQEERVQKGCMEAIWKIEVENFPAFILVDDKGNDFFKQLKPWNCKK